MKKYFGKTNMWEYDYSDNFVICENKKKWLDCIIQKYIYSDVYINGELININKIKKNIEWIEITEEEYKTLSKYLGIEIPLKKYFEDNGMTLSNKDMTMTKTWIDVKGKILKLEESTQKELLNLLIKLNYEFDIGDEIIEAYEYEGNLMDNDFKCMELSDNVAYLSTNKAEDFNNLKNIIDYQYLKDKYEKNLNETV